MQMRSGFSISSHCKAITMLENRESWSEERVALLKRCFHAGLSCSQIAREIGVTRNAVIGKMHRLGLSRPKDIVARQRAQRHAAKLAHPKTQRIARPKRSRLNIFAQREILMAAFGETKQRAEDVPIYNGRGCTLLELSQAQCRWPISTPGADDFCYCGNEPIRGLPYCAGHARIAYRPAGRPRNSVPA
jgi:GcrA cell cycle regulator